MWAATLNLRVLKAQLLMIRAQGIAPRTCPAYAKFRLFAHLRRYIVVYFAIHTFLIVAQMWEMPLWAQAALLVMYATQSQSKSGPWRRLRGTLSDGPSVRFADVHRWELVQLTITAGIGWLFAKGGYGLQARGGATNPFLDREAHLPTSEVATHGTSRKPARMCDEPWDCSAAL